MLLTITCEAERATDLGYLLHKNPANVFTEETGFGSVTVFYPEAAPDRCTAALLLEIDPIGLIRGGSRRAAGLAQYVNDRPYVASSLLCVGIATAFGTAMNGRCKERPERVEEKLPLRIQLSALNCGGGEALLTRLFAPLGYTITAQRQPLDARFPAWGDSDVYAITLEGMQTVQDALTQLYVLIPVLDNAKHYYVGDAEVEKLLRKGARWLPSHPEQNLITRRYLAYRQTMVRSALAQLQELREDTMETQDESDVREEAQEAAGEAPLRLNEARLLAALEAVRTLQPPAASVLDLGCGEGNLIKKLMQERSLKQIVGVDVASHVLERAAQNLHLDTLPEYQQQRIRLIQGSLVYQDARFAGFDVALLIEVIEHLDPPRLTALERVVFAEARPRRVVITTPNAEYNVTWPSLPAGKFRHRDHRFEWTRAEFAVWAERAAGMYGYTVSLQDVGPEDAALGAPTQMALFDREEK
ncbi:MAG TPA: 3' terminal RNA ribose 2'-O-methyltransferase Hen1 [Chthonomonadaceae bacterium]|nr:3' terminal RNA ribose 2'-O-methyltransferase Hen1 [Chthonomonadaceae bacterium]